MLLAGVCVFYAHKKVSALGLTLLSVIVFLSVSECVLCVVRAVHNTELRTQREGGGRGRA